MVLFIYFVGVTPFRIILPLFGSLGVCSKIVAFHVDFDIYFMYDVECKVISFVIISDVILQVDLIKSERARKLFASLQYAFLYKLDLLTHLRRVDSSTTILWTGLFPTAGYLVSFYRFHRKFCI